MKQIVFFLLALVALTACQTQQRSESYRNVGFIGDTYSNDGEMVSTRTGGIPASYGDASGGVVSVNPAPGPTSAFSPDQMIIYNAYLDMTVKNVDTASARIIAVAKKYEGYVVSAGNRSTSIRVKSEHLNSALKELEVLGKVTSKNISGDDVTQQFKNLNIRLDNARKARQRYLDLLAKAEDVKAALEVEKELERLNNEIDLLESQMNNIGMQVQYSRITVSLQERTRPGILGYVFVGIYKGVKWLFVWD